MASSASIWPQSHGRDLLYTFIWNCLFGLLFTLFGIIGNWRMPSANFFWINFVVSNCVGYTLHALFFLGGCTIESRIREAGRVVVTAYYMAMSTVGVLGGVRGAVVHAPGLLGVVHQGAATPRRCPSRRYPADGRAPVRAFLAGSGCRRSCSAGASCRAWATPGGSWRSRSRAS